MKNNDISNQPAPAIAIDVDGLIVTEIKSWWFGRKTFEIVPVAEKWIHQVFSKEVSIYLLCFRPVRESAEIRMALDDEYFPYTRWYNVQPGGLQKIIEQPHVTTYLYSGEFIEHQPPLNVLSKGRRVQTIGEGLG